MTDETRQLESRDVWDLAAGARHPAVEAAVTASPADFAGRESASQLRDEIAQELRWITSRLDGVRLMGRLAAWFANPPREGELNQSVPSRLQFVLAVVASAEERLPIRPGPSSARDVIQLTRDLFELERWLLAAEPVEGDDYIALLRAAFRAEQLEDREVGYVRDLGRIATALSERIGVAFERTLGWHPLDLWTTANTAAHVSGERLSAQHAALLRDLGIRPDQPPDDDALVEADRISRDKNYLAFRWTAASVAVATGIPMERTECMLEGVQLPRGKAEEILPHTLNPREWVGGLAVPGEGWFLFQPWLLMQFWLDVIGAAVHRAESAQLSAQWTKARAGVLEQLTANALRETMLRSIVTTNVKWQEFETDVLVLSTDDALIVECKSKTVAASARRGAPRRLEKTTEEVLAKSFEQTARLRDELQSGQVRFVPDQGKAFDVGFSADASLPCMTVTLERVDPLAMLAAWADTGHHINWMLCLQDLLMVCEDLPRDTLFWDYARARYRLASSPQWWITREKDALGFHVTAGDLGQLGQPEYEQLIPGSQWTLGAFGTVVDQRYRLWEQADRASRAGLIHSTNPELDTAKPDESSA
jgi:hypothetical protein